jgi:opacity protein-like surface antigen
MRNILIVFSFILSAISLHASAQESPWVIEASALSGYYQYDALEVKKNLSAEFQAGLDGNDLVDQDDDLINYSLSVGYRINHDLLVKLTFVDGLDLDPFLQDFCILLCPNDDLIFNLDMYLYEFDVEFIAYRFNDYFDLFMGAGLVVADLDGEIIRFADGQHEVVSEDDHTETGIKATIGLNWRFSNSFTLSLGHQRHSIFSMTKTYLSMRYDF